MSDYFDVLCGDKAFSAFAVQISPLAGLDEVGPVKRMKFRIALEHVELHRSQRFAAAHCGHRLARQVGDALEQRLALSG